MSRSRVDMTLVALTAPALQGDATFRFRPSSNLFPSMISRSIHDESMKGIADRPIQVTGMHIIPTFSYTTSSGLDGESSCDLTTPSTCT